MIETQLLDLIVSGGSNVGFAIFLFWQYNKAEKKSEERELKFEERERDLRNRYDSVIAEYRCKETELYSKIESLIKLMERD